MESVDCLKSGAPPFSGEQANAVAEWHSIPLEESQPETDYCFLLTDKKQTTQPSRKVAQSMCGLSNFVGGDATDENNVVSGHRAPKADCKYISIKASDDYSGVKEVRVSIHGLEDPKRRSGSAVYKAGDKAVNDSGPILGHVDDGCFPLVQQVRAFIKGAKLSCTGLLSGDGNLLNGWSSLLQRSFSFKSSETSSSEGEFLCKKSNSSALTRTTLGPTPATSVPNIDTPNTIKVSPLQARDPASRAEALPLAHYRPTDGASWTEGDSKTGLSTAASAPSKSLVNCKKPPKPPRHPGRSASLDSTTMAAQRAARKSRDRAFAKRKSRGAASAAASAGLTPLLALVLTIGFGVLMVFQGVFVQTNVSYGRNTDGGFVDVSANSRSSLPTQRGGSYDRLHPIDMHLPASLKLDVSNSEALLSGALQKSMTDLPWSRSSLVTQMKSTLA